MPKFEKVSTDDLALSRQQRSRKICTDVTKKELEEFKDIVPEDLNSKESRDAAEEQSKAMHAKPKPNIDAASRDIIAATAFFNSEVLRATGVVDRLLPAKKLDRCARLLNKCLRMGDFHGAYLIYIGTFSGAAGQKIREVYNLNSETEETLKQADHLFLRRKNLDEYAKQLKDQGITPIYYFGETQKELGLSAENTDSGAKNEAIDNTINKFMTAQQDVLKGVPIQPENKNATSFWELENLYRLTDENLKHMVQKVDYEYFGEDDLRDYLERAIKMQIPGILELDDFKTLTDPVKETVKENLLAGNIKEVDPKHLVEVEKNIVRRLVRDLDKKELIFADTKDRPAVAVERNITTILKSRQAYHQLRKKNIDEIDPAILDVIHREKDVKEGIFYREAKRIAGEKSTMLNANKDTILPLSVFDEVAKAQVKAVKKQQPQTISPGTKLDHNASMGSKSFNSFSNFYQNITGKTKKPKQRVGLPNSNTPPSSTFYGDTKSSMGGGGEGSSKGPEGERITKKPSK